MFISELVRLGWIASRGDEALGPWRLLRTAAQTAPDRLAEGGAAVAPAAVRVIDGDTFEHDGMRVRVADIDAPELDGRCAYETELAARATGRLRALLVGGDVARSPSPDGRDEDRYGRKLRIVAARSVAFWWRRDWRGRGPGGGSLGGSRLRSAGQRKANRVVLPWIENGGPE